MNCRRLISLAVPVGLLAVVLRPAPLPAEPPAAAKLQFNRDVRAILSNNCFACHGPDEKHRKGGLRLDTFEGAIADHEGRRAVIPGKPDASELMKRLLTHDEDDLMPPADTGKRLTPEQKQILRTWIEQGAPYQKHWAFEPLAQPALPALKNPGWAKNEIDQFILAGLEARNLQPSPEAAKETLIRRAYLDLIGLPPSPAEVAAFVADASPQAFEKVVDQLLANPHYGERWGRHWLDQARYADSNGYSIDSPRQIWPYRDWVINAHNTDMPFDQFTVEQLAGDLLDKPTPAQLIATGFHRNTMINQEGGSDPEQFRVEAAVDRVSTTGSVWLGLTVGCAQCHTHKFDPITHKEFYQFYAFFNSDADRNGIEPTLKLPSEEHQRKANDLKKQLAELKKSATISKDTKPISGRADGAQAAAPTQWTIATPQAFTAKSGAPLKHLDDHSLLAGGKNPDEEAYTVTVKSPLKTITAIRVEAMTHETLPKKGPGRASNGNFVLHEIKVIDVNAAPHDFTDAQADHEQTGYPVDHAIDGKLETGWAINAGKGAGPTNVNRAAIFLFAKPLKIIADEGFHVELQFAPGPRGYALGRFRVSVTGDAQPKLRGAASDIAAGKPADPTTAKRIKEMEQAIKALEATSPSTLVMKKLPEPRPSFVFIRGDFLRHGEPVTPGTLSVMHPFKPRAAVHSPQDLGPQTQPAAMADRLDLAKWIVDPANPLTPRVTVNRIWMRYFGTGLVETENDFGTQGSPPTHPELLDWLSRRFIADGWSMKKLHRLIVTSATYRQSSMARPELTAADPLNKLLGRQNRLRVEAEIVRDLALGSSGLLAPKIGGPSVYPPQPEGVFAFTQVKQKWPTSMGEDRYRRGVYTFVYRASPYPQLTTFDVPRPDVTCTRRVRSNTPLQSLTQANSIATVEMAQALAARVMKEAPDDRSRLLLAFKLCLSRPPSDSELSVLSAYLDGQAKEFAADSDAAKKLAPKSAAGIDPARAAAWTAVARVLLNVDEFITRE